MNFCGTLEGAAMTAQDPYRAAIGQRISQARSHAGLTQIDVADACGVGKKTVSRWEDGRTSPPADAVGVICDLVGCSADWLVGRPRSESSTLYAINSRTEALLLSSDRVDDEWLDRWSRLGTMLDEATTIVSMGEFVERTWKIRAHRDRLLRPKEGGLHEPTEGN